jgi:hypothetical protein
MLNNPDINKLVSPSSQKKATMNSIGTSAITFQYQGQLGAGNNIVQSIQTQAQEKESLNKSQSPLLNLASVLKTNMGISR